MAACCGRAGRPEPIIGMENPYYYRNKVHAVYKHLRSGEIVAGTYQEGTHRVVPVENCQIEDQEAGRVIQTIRRLLKSFRIKVYNEDTGYGLFPPCADPIDIRIARCWWCWWRHPPFSHQKIIL